MRYTGPKCRLCRREGVKLFLKGEKCEGQKCTLVKRPTLPGAHPRGGGKPTEYARQLREKQKAKRIFGMSETQFRNLFVFAASKQGATGDMMMQLLEKRLDNAVYRSGLVSSRNLARQLVNHGAFLVNGKKVKTPSIRLKVGDQVQLSEDAKSSNLFANKKLRKDTSPKWLDTNINNYSFTMAHDPEKDDFESIVESRLIVEYYSRN